MPTFRKKCSACALLLALLASLWLALPVFAQANAEAAQLPQGSYEVTSVESGQALPALTDENRNTGVSLMAGDDLHIQSDEPFAYIYLIWDRPPAEGQLTLPGGEAQPFAANGFLHELIELDAAAAEATLSPGGAWGDSTSPVPLCDVYLFAKGDLPDWVQRWQPACERADLLVLPTHADDEHLFFGGTLATYAGERQLAVQVAYMTNHWGEPYRPHELLNGLWVAGVTAYPVIGPFADAYSEDLATAESQYGRDAVTAFQVELLRRFKPYVVVAHDINGEYGHGAHMLNASTLLDALDDAADPERYPETAEALGVWDTPKAYLHLWAENQIEMDWHQPLERFGGETGLEMAVAGFAEHRSQQSYFKVEDGGQYDNALFGLARSTVGPDVLKDDFFENIDLNPEPEPEPASSSLPAAPVSSQPAQSPAPSQSAQDGRDAKEMMPVIALIGGAAAVLVLAVVLAVSLQRRKKPAAKPQATAKHPASTGSQISEKPQPAAESPVPEKQPPQEPPAEQPPAKQPPPAAPHGKQVYRRSK